MQMLPKQKPSQAKLPLPSPLPQNEKWCAWEVPAPSVAKERSSKEKQLMAAHGGARAAHGESLSRNSTAPHGFLTLCRKNGTAMYKNSQGVLKILQCLQNFQNALQIFPLLRGNPSDKFPRFCLFHLSAQQPNHRKVSMGQKKQGKSWHVQ